MVAANNCWMRVFPIFKQLKETRIKSELARKSFHSLMAIILIPQILYGKEGGFLTIYAIPPYY